jgi:hypothetical protein
MNRKSLNKYYNRLLRLTYGISTDDVGELHSSITHTHQIKNEIKRISLKYNLINKRGDNYE